MNKLYRSSDEKVIAGVCSGIAHRLDLNVTGLRWVVALVTLFLSGIPALAYGSLIRDGQEPPKRAARHSRIMFQRNGRYMTLFSKMRCRFSNSERFMYHCKELEMPTNIFYECGSKVFVTHEYIVYKGITNKIESVRNFLVEPKEIIPNAFISFF